ncbi:ANTAR domain-containing protein [Amycolatopsis sp. NPDC059027]|uniref:ANTAR domain-containing protein n=1 Tax=unclassified Amycolatopsis TaxID=2618356 RepID=UPI0036713B57
MNDRERWLAEALVDLADTVDADFDEAEYAHTVTARLAELLEPGEPGLRLADAGGTVRTTVASTRRLGELLALEADVTEGPCTSSQRGGKDLVNDVLGLADTKWPRYAPAARKHGFASVSTMSLRHGESVVGSLCVLSPLGSTVTGTEIRSAGAVVSVATTGILHNRMLRDSTRTSSQLQYALTSRVLVEQAKGAVAVRLGVPPGEAFDILRAYARRHNLPLNDVAKAAIDGKLSGYDLIADLAPRRKRVSRGGQPR